MSLYTQWQEITNKIVDANEICESMWDETYFVGYQPNKWRFRWYSVDKGSGTYQPQLSDITNKTFNTYGYLADGYTSKFNRGDKYIGYVDCMVHCTQDTNLSITATNDDYGVIFLDDVLQFRINTVGSVTGTVKFKKGWNHLQYIFYEYGGDDYAYINKALHSQSFIDEMYAYGEEKSRR